MSDMHDADLRTDRDNNVPGRNGPPSWMGALPTDKDYNPANHKRNGKPVPAAVRNDVP